jgi:putative transposase
MVWDLEECSPHLHFLIHDNDSKFTEALDTIFGAERVHIIHTPFRAPNANAFAERWVRTVRNECLDKLLIFTEAHLQRCSPTPSFGSAHTYSKNFFYGRRSCAMSASLGRDTN